MMVTDDRKDSDRESRVPQNLVAIETYLRQCIDIAERGERAFFGPDFVNRYASYAALIQARDAVKDLPDAFRIKHAEVNWRVLARTRDEVGHIYGDGIDWDIVWAALLYDIPADLDAITRIRATLG